MMKIKIKTLALISLVLFVAVALFVALSSSNSPLNIAKIVRQSSSTGNAGNPNIVEAMPGTQPDAQPTLQDSRCIITVNGNRYDVTNFRDQHSGGNVFVCGTDMTSIFFSQHGSGTLQKMAPYLIN
jgi:hypothetical protein